MDAQRSRDLDGIIDDVARTMTSTGLARDLRPAVASRLAGPAPWMFGWRAGLVGAAVAAVVMVAVVMRPAPEPQRPQAVAVTRGARAATPPPILAPHAPVSDAPSEAQGGLAGRPARPVARQTIVESEMAGVVDISPVAIVPLEEAGDEEDTVSAASPMVDIAPIDVEPLRISELELVE
jgi:hypothetical protein